MSSHDAFTALLKKESGALFSSPIAYVLIAVFLGIVGYTFVSFLFVTKQVTLLHVIYQSALLLVLLTPLNTMRLLAEERRSGTLELLLTSPIKEVHIVIAKFLGGFSVAGAMVVLTLIYPLSLSFLADVGWEPVIGGYVGLLALAAALTALGLAISGCTESHVVAATASTGIFLLLWMSNGLSQLLPDPWDTLFANLSPLTHLMPLATGSLYLSDIAYFGTVTILGLLGAYLSLARR